MIHLTCPKCMREFDVPDSAAGKKASCPCGEKMTVFTASMMLEPDETDGLDRPLYGPRDKPVVPAASTTAGEDVAPDFTGLAVCAWVLTVAAVLVAVAGMVELDGWMTVAALANSFVLLAGCFVLLAIRSIAISAFYLRFKR